MQETRDPKIKIQSKRENKLKTRKTKVTEEANSKENMEKSIFNENETLKIIENGKTLR